MSISSLSLDLKSSPQSRCSGTAAASADTAAQTKTKNLRNDIVHGLLRSCCSGVRMRTPRGLEEVARTLKISIEIQNSRNQACVSEISG